MKSFMSTKSVRKVKIIQDLQGQAIGEINKISNKINTVAINIYLPVKGVKCFVTTTLPTFKWFYFCMDSDMNFEAV